MINNKCCEAEGEMSDVVNLNWCEDLICVGDLSQVETCWDMWDKWDQHLNIREQKIFDALENIITTTILRDVPLFS